MPPFTRLVQSWQPPDPHPLLVPFGRAVFKVVLDPVSVLPASFSKPLPVLCLFCIRGCSKLHFSADFFSDSSVIFHLLYPLQGVYPFFKGPVRESALLNGFFLLKDFPVIDFG